MARSEARVSVDIWSDPDFLALAVEAQRLYFFLLSQPDVAHDGVLALRERRWAGTAAGLSVEDVRRQLAVLGAARFVVVDEQSEELLIRSFIRRDGVYRQPNLLRAARKHLPLVLSPQIRAILLTELRRVRSLDDVPKGSVVVVDDMIAELDAMPTSNPSAKGSSSDIGDSRGVYGPTVTPAQEPAGENPSGMGSANPSAMPLGDRGVVTTVTTGSPYALDPLPLPLSPDPLSPAANPSPPRRSRADLEFDRFWAAYPRREAKGAARKAWDKAIKRATPDRIVAGAERYRDQPGREPQYTAHPATWLNADRWTDEPAPRHDRRPSPGLVEHDGLMLSERTIADMQRRERLAALETETQQQRAIGA